MGGKKDIMKYNIGHTPLCVCVCSSLYMKAVPFPFHVVSTVNLPLKQTALVLSTVTICCRNTDVHVNVHDRIILVIFSQALYKAA